MPNLGLTWFRPTSNAKISYQATQSSILGFGFKCKLWCS